jgi:hypothetical protein
MRIFKIVVAGLITYLVVEVIFIVSYIAQSPNKTNGPGALLFPLANYSFTRSVHWLRCW